MEKKISTLSDSLIDEIVGAVGMPKNAITHKLFWYLFRRVTNRLAALSSTFDQIVAESGLPKASDWMLSHFCKGLTARGTEHIPQEGPLLIVSNHPGSIDGLIIFSKLQRQDIKCIVGPIPFLDILPYTRNHMIFTSRTCCEKRVEVLRKSIQHLRKGGALVYFGAGHLEPDPAVFKGSEKMIDQWQPGLNFLLDHAPDTRLVQAIVSSVITPEWAETRFRHLRRKEVDRIRISNFTQTMYQLLFPGRLFSSSFVSFAPSVPREKLMDECQCADVSPAIIARQKALLAEHCNLFGGYAV